MSAPVFLRVLVGWDGSHSAAMGLSIACGLTACPGGRVVAVSVVPDFCHIEANEDRARALADARAPLQDAYDRVLASLSIHPEQRVSLRFLQDEHVAAALDHYAAENPWDLVVVGLHGHEGLLHPRVGHIAHHVVQTSECPVLVIPGTSEPGAAADGLTPLARAVKGLFHPGHRQPAGV